MERGFRADVKAVIWVMIGAGLGALLIGNFDALLYAAIALTIFIILSAVVRGWRHRLARPSGPPGR